ncbi:MAG: S-adenosyl-l-methionine hydroxide adenosyltransferase family protein [Acidimicrobiia bacterium]
MFVSFVSDFGLTDEFVGVVHGVIARLAPTVRVIDVTHGIPPGGVRAGALVLSRAIQYLPEGVALAVVDPGVGGERAAVAVETSWGTFIGPDNGLLAPAVAMTGGGVRAVTIDNPEMSIPSAGATFEGRDRFAPAAALVASDQVELMELGREIDPSTLTPLMLPLPEVTEEGVDGEVWWVDRFGNAETNIAPEHLSELGLQVGDALEARIGGESHVLTWVKSYVDGEPGRPVAVVDSAGLVSLAVNGGRANEQLRAFDRTAVRFTRP